MSKSNLIPFLRENLDILFVGLNPADGSSANGHYFSVKQNFWNQLYDSGLINNHVDKMEADDIVFGSNEHNVQGWNFGITDLVTEIADSNSGNINPTYDHYVRLEGVIRKYRPKVVILLQAKVHKEFLSYLGYDHPGANYGRLDKILEGTDTMFFSIAFPHGNRITDDDKIEKYELVKNYLFNRLKRAKRKQQSQTVKDDLDEELNKLKSKFNG